MPIEVSLEIQVLNQADFHTLHHQLLGIVFEVHNQFGRFLNEMLFKKEIAARCEAAGLGPALREIQVRVSHDGFCKDYFLDLLLCHSLLVEIKAAETLTLAHRSQTLNYVLLIGLRHGSLINLRPERVQHEFVSTGLTPEKRRQFAVIEKGWRALDDESKWLKDKTIALLEDWSAFLEISLYRDAIAHFLGGAQTVVKPVPVYSGHRLLGEQPVHLLNSETAFAFTAITGDRSGMEEHQRRFLRHTPLKAVQWINLNHHEIEFRTLIKT
jgi:GxxExxY protein